MVYTCPARADHPNAESERTARARRQNELATEVGTQRQHKNTRFDDDDDDNVPKHGTKILDLTTGPYLGVVPTSPYTAGGQVPHTARHRLTGSGRQAIRYAYPRALGDDSKHDFHPWRQTHTRYASRCAP